LSRYLAPEYFMHGIVDEKTDIFAFGVLLLEIVTGRRPIDCSKQSLLQWVRTRDKNIRKKLCLYLTAIHMYDFLLMSRQSHSWRLGKRLNLPTRTSEMTMTRINWRGWSPSRPAALCDRQCGGPQWPRYHASNYYLIWTDWHVKCSVITKCQLLCMSSFRFCISCLLMIAWRNQRNGTFPRTRLMTWMIAHCFLNLVPHN